MKKISNVAGEFKIYIVFVSDTNDCECVFLPKGLLCPMAFSARFFCRRAYTANTMRPRTKTEHPTAIPAIAPVLILVPPCVPEIRFFVVSLVSTRNLYKGRNINFH